MYSQSLSALFLRQIECFFDRLRVLKESAPHLLAEHLSPFNLSLLELSLGLWNVVLH